MKNELPEGWEWVKIGECFEQVKDKIEPTENTSLTYIGLEHLVKGGGVDIAGNSDSLKSTKSVFQKGDVLYGKLRPYLNKHSFVDFDGVCSTDILVFRAANLSAAKYLNYYLGTNEVISYANENSQGINLPRVSGKVMGEMSIPLPPLAEQTRIVAKLDAAFGHLETLKASLSRIPELLKKFRQTVLSQAVTGKLVKRKGMVNWQNTSLKNVTDRITDGDHQSPPKSESGVPFIVISDISKGKLNLINSTRFVPETYYNLINEYRKPRRNDVLYTVTGSIGIPILVDTDEKFCFQRHIGLIRPDTGIISPKFLLYLLGSTLIYQQAKDVATGTAQMTIPLSGIRNFAIQIPPLEEQHEIVTRVEALFAKADALEAQYGLLKAKIDKLPNALLAKAFRGALVPQNPNDEPASVLLARLKSAPAPGGKTKIGQTKLAFM